MSTIVKIRQALPADFAEVLQRFRAEESPTRLDSLLLAARLNGWTLQALATPLGLTRERVRQRIAMASPDVNLPTIPLPPRRVSPSPKPPRHRRLRLTDALIAELCAMHAIATTVNGGTPTDDPSRRVSEHYSAQLAAYVEQGISVRYLAEVIGVTDGAIHMRLARHGYRKPCPSLADQKYLNRKTDFERQRKNACGPDHLSGPNLRISQPSGRASCRACERLAGRAYYARKRAEAMSGAAS